MAVSQDELTSFNQFVAQQIATSSEDVTFSEILDLWRIQNPTADEFDQNVAAVKAAIRDMEDGDRGVPLEDHLREMRKKHSLPLD